MLIALFFHVGLSDIHQAGDGERCNGMCHKSWGCPQKRAVLKKQFTQWDLARKAGHVCGTKFPYYNGGYPILNLDYDSEDEEYKCLNSTGEFCKKWSAIERSREEWEYGTCECLQGAKFCSYWECNQIEGRKCYREGEWTQGGEWIEVSGKPPENGKRYQCCKQGNLKWFIYFQ